LPPTDGPKDEPDKKEGLGGGAITAITLVCLVSMAAVAYAGMIYRRRRAGYRPIR
jgi:hypothetical protein